MFKAEIQEALELLRQIAEDIALIRSTVRNMRAKG